MISRCDEDLGGAETKNEKNLGLYFSFLIYLLYFCTRFAPKMVRGIVKIIINNTKLCT